MISIYMSISGLSGIGLVGYWCHYFH